MTWTAAARKERARAQRYAPGPGEQIRAANERDETLLPHGRPAARRAWNPAQGARSVAEQRPPAPPALLPDGSVVGTLWASSEGPCRVDPGGAGGSPDGRSLPIRKVVWD